MHGLVRQLVADGTVRTQRVASVLSRVDRASFIDPTHAAPGHAYEVRQASGGTWAFYVHHALCMPMCSHAVLRLASSLFSLRRDARHPLTTLCVPPAPALRYTCGGMHACRTGRCHSAATRQSARRTCTRRPLSCWSSTCSPVGGGLGERARRGRRQQAPGSMQQLHVNVTRGLNDHAWLLAVGGRRGKGISRASTAIQRSDSQQPNMLMAAHSAARGWPACGRAWRPGVGGWAVQGPGRWTSAAAAAS